MKKRLWIGVVLLVVVAGGAVFALRSQKADSEPLAADPALQSPVKQATEVMAEAKVVPVQYALLTFPVGGTVHEVLVKEGERVAEGQIIARLNAAQQAAMVAQSEAQLQRAQARLAELLAGPRSVEIGAARAAVDVAEANLARVKQSALPEEILSAEMEVHRAEEMLKAAAQTAAMKEAAGQHTTDIEAAKAQLAAATAGLARLREGSSAQDVAAAEAEVRRAQAQYDLQIAATRPETIAAAEADVASASAGLEQAKAALANLELKAPFAGTVAQLDLRVGETVSPGIALVRMGDLSAWQIETDDLTELKVARVREGAPVKITLDAIPELELTGTVDRIRAVGEKKQGDITFTVVVRPSSTDERLRWNMTATVAIQSN